MRTLEEIDAEIAQNEKDLGVSVVHCAQYDNYLDNIRTELVQAAGRIRRRSQLEAQKKALNDEKARRLDIGFGYFVTALGLVCVGVGLSAMVWVRDGVPGGLFFIAFGIAISFIGFGPAQRAHARKPAVK